ncbi:MAG: hypothetical protein ACYCUG_14325, partial [Acidimicrobiales bacterium]
VVVELVGVVVELVGVVVELVGVVVELVGVVVELVGGGLVKVSVRVASQVTVLPPPLAEPLH